MSAKNKVRGNIAENYVLERAEAHGVECERAWGSDGRAMGLSSQDDGLLGWYRWQSKRFKWDNVVKWFLRNAVEYLQGDQDVVTIYIDRAAGHPRTVYVVQELESWLRLKKLATLYGKENKPEEDDE